MTKRIYVAGHRGMVGSALCRQLSAKPDVELVLRTREQLNLTDQSEVQAFFNQERIDEVYLAAAKVGGIYANDHYPAEFIYENLMIECNVIHAAYLNKVQDLLLLGSSCIYPRLAKQPMQEAALLTGELEATNEPYAVAKIAGIKLCESYNRQYGTNYRSVMPTNLYGPDDNFHADNGHVVPALIRRLHNAKLAMEPSVVIWGSGQPMREFLYVDDMASACVHVMNLSADRYNNVASSRLSHINVGTGLDCSIRELAEIIQHVVGYQGELVFDVSKPDGAPRKLLNVERLSELGWRATVDLRQGLAITYQWFLDNQASLRGTNL